MKEFKRIFSALLCAALLLNILCACGETDTAAEDKPTLSVCIPSEQTTLDPAFCAERGAGVIRHLFENLMRLSDDGSGIASVAPGMAKSYELVENEDGTETYMFHLRETARWTDDVKVSAADFVYAWQRLCDSATDSPYAYLLSDVVGYESVRSGGDPSALGVAARDKHTFTVTLARHDPNFIENVCAAVATMPLRKDVVQTSPDAWSSGVGLVTNGAYRIADWKRGVYLDLEANTGYYEYKLLGPGYIHFMFTNDADAAYALYEEGTVDFISNVPSAVAAELAADKDWSAAPSASTYAVFVNNRNTPLDETALRRALRLSINYDAVAEAAGIGRRAASGLVPYGIADAPDAAGDFRSVGGADISTAAEDYITNCIAARQEYAQASAALGEIASLEYIYEEGASNRAVALAVQSAWRDVLGLSVTLRSVSGEELQTALESGDYQLAGRRIDAQYNGALTFLDRWTIDNSENYINYYNEIYDVLIGVTNASLNANARVAFLHDAESLLMEDAAIFPLYYYGSVSLLREKWQGVYCDVTGNYFFHAVKEKLPDNLT